MKYLLLVFATASVLFPAMAIAATVGFYAGTFDPPTQAEIGNDSLRFRRCQRSANNAHKSAKQFRA